MPKKGKLESTAEKNAAEGGVAAVDKALALLTVFDAGADLLTLAELTARTGLYRSTALRMLASLEHAQLVQRRPDGRYMLGPTVARLNSVYIDSFQLGDVVVPVLRGLVEVTGESAAFHIRQGSGGDWKRLSLFRVHSPKTVRDHEQAGTFLPTDKGAGARVLRAFGDPAEWPVAPDERALYEQIRADGYYATVGDRLPELGGISAPVFYRSGALAGAISLTIPEHRYSTKVVPDVVDAARKLSRLLP